MSQQNVAPGQDGKECSHPEKNASATDRVRQLYEQLKKIQEAKGFFFNDDPSMTMSLLEQLLVTKSRYGYMACPCRYANGALELDRDIICPCVYRVPDLEEYGACYCGLYVTPYWNEGKIPKVTVPERRPPEKIIFSGKL